MTFAVGSHGELYPYAVLKTQYSLKLRQFQIHKYIYHKYTIKKQFYTYIQIINLSKKQIKK